MWPYSKFSSCTNRILYLFDIYIEYVACTARFIKWKIVNENDRSIGVSEKNTVLKMRALNNSLPALTTI